MQLIKWNPWPSFPVTLTEDAPTSRQLLSWEWYCYPILLIHFESVAACLLPHRRSLKVLFCHTALLGGVSLAACVFSFLPVIAVRSGVECLSWHSRKTEWVSDMVVPGSQGLPGSCECLVCKVESTPSRRFFTQARSVQDGRGFAWHGTQTVLSWDLQ